MISTSFDSILPRPNRISLTKHSKLAGDYNSLLADRHEDGKIALSRTTLRVYRYLDRAERPLGIHNIQRGLGLSSSSVAQFHAKKLWNARLIKWDERSGHYSIDRLIVDNMIRLRKSIPLFRIGVAKRRSTRAFLLLL